MDNKAAQPNWDQMKPVTPPASPATPAQAPAAAPSAWDQMKPVAQPQNAKAPAGWDQMKVVGGEPPQSTQTVRLPAGLHPDVQSTVDEVAKAKGIPVWALRAIARLESGGQAHPDTAASPVGAQGVLQLLPSTFKEVSPHGNILNMRDNIEAGATYYQTLLKKYKDPILAAGAYNAGPGAFDAYLAGKGSLTQETKNYMVNAAAMHTPIDDTPLPQHIPTAAKAAPKLPQKRQPTQGKSNLDPSKAKYEWYDQLFGHQDLPFVLDNAALADQIMPGAGHMQKALTLYAKNPAAALKFMDDLVPASTAHAIEEGILGLIGVVRHSRHAGNSSLGPDQTGQEYEPDHLGRGIAFGQHRAAVVCQGGSVAEIGEVFAQAAYARSQLVLGRNLRQRAALEPDEIVEHGSIGGLGGGAHIEGEAGFAARVGRALAGQITGIRIDGVEHHRGRLNSGHLAEKRR